MTPNNKQHTFIFSRNWSCCPLQLSKDDILNIYIKFSVHEKRPSRKALQFVWGGEEEVFKMIFPLFCCLMQ